LYRFTHPTVLKKYKSRLEKMSSEVENCSKRIKKPRRRSQAPEIRQASPPQGKRRLRKILPAGLGGHQDFLIGDVRWGRLESIID
jgi:hypothetical protein